MIQQFLAKVRELYRRFQDAEIPVRAAALGYHTLLAIVPAIVLVFWYLNTVGVTKEWFILVKGFIFANLNVDASSNLEKYLLKFTSSVKSSSWGFVGLGVFLYTVVNLIVKLGNDLDRILNTRPVDVDFRSRFWILVAKRAFVMIALPMALMLSLVVMSWLREDSLFRYVFHFKTVGNWLAVPLPILIDAIGFFMIYQFVPQRPLQWRQTLKAALLTAVIYELGKWGVSTYNRHALMTQKIYGTLSVIPIFIIWIQVAWTIILSGALLIRVPGEKRH